MPICFYAKFGLRHIFKIADNVGQIPRDGGSQEICGILGIIHLLSGKNQLEFLMTPTDQYLHLFCSLQDHSFNFVDLVEVVSVLFVSTILLVQQIAHKNKFAYAIALVRTFEVRSR